MSSLLYSIVHYAYLNLLSTQSQYSLLIFTNCHDLNHWNFIPLLWHYVVFYVRQGWNTQVEKMLSKCLHSDYVEVYYDVTSIVKVESDLGTIQ